MTFDLARAMAATRSTIGQWSDALPRRAGRHAVLAALFAWLGVMLAARLAGPIHALPLHVSFNQNEGWNAYWTARAMAGEPLYTDNLSAISNNYTPLSFYIVGALARLVGDPIIAGRLVCLAALTASATLVERIASAAGARRQWSVAAALCLVLFVGAVAPAYIAADDPQWLAEVPMLGALLVLVRRDRGWSSRRLALACALMLVSGLVKPCTVALPIATTAWLAIVDRAALRRWLACVAIGGTLALALLAALFGVAAIGEIAGHDRVMHARLLASSANTLLPLLPVLALAGAIGWSLRSRPTASPALLLLLVFTAVALVLGIVERLGTGTAQNVHFDAALGLFVIAAVGLSHDARRRAGWDVRWSRLTGFALILLPLGIATVVRAPGAIVRIADHDDAARDWAEAIAFLRTQRGDVACERAALCYWAGKRFVLDFSNYGQKLRTRDPAGLADAIRQERFAAIVSLRDKRYDAFNSRLPLAYNRLIEAHYTVRQALPDHLFVLVPRR